MTRPLSVFFAFLIACNGGDDEVVEPSAFEGTYDVDRYLVDGEDCEVGVEEPWTEALFQLAAVTEGAGEILEVRPCESPGNCLPANHFEWTFNLFFPGEATGADTHVDHDPDTELCTLIWGEMLLTLNDGAASLVRETWYNDDEISASDIAGCEDAQLTYDGEKVCVTRRQLDGNAR